MKKLDREEGKGEKRSGGEGPGLVEGVVDVEHALLLVGAGENREVRVDWGDAVLGALGVMALDELNVLEEVVVRLVHILEELCAILPRWDFHERGHKGGEGAQNWF